MDCRIRSNRVGGADSPDFSHHCAYGSVHGGSIAQVQGLVLVGYTVISGLCESLCAVKIYAQKVCSDSVR